MERLYEKLLRVPTSCGNPSAVSVSTIIVADNVAEYIAEAGAYRTLRDFPNLAPPFNDMFIEALVPKSVVAQAKAPDPGQAVLHGTGVLVQATRANTAERRSLEEMILEVEAMRKEDGRKEEWLLREVVCSGAEWVLNLSTYLDFGHTFTPNPVAETFIAVGKDGVPVTGSDGEILAEGSCFEDAPVELRSEPALTFQETALLAISFMHCRNVRQVESLPSSKTVKRLVNAGQPVVRFTTLVIDPMKDVLRREGGSGAVGLQKALHICRGHFAHYTEERKLFGKHEGTFWVPQHVRGTLEKGAVAKKYVVGAPEQQSAERRQEA